jgi:hypothetical protein
VPPRITGDRGGRPALITAWGHRRRDEENIWHSVGRNVAITTNAQERSTESSPAASFLDHRESDAKACPAYPPTGGHPRSNRKTISHTAPAGAVPSPALGIAKAKARATACIRHLDQPQDQANQAVVGGLALAAPASSRFGEHAQHAEQLRTILNLLRPATT